MNLVKLMNKYNKIHNNLYIGNHLAPIDNDFIKKNNIRLIINCTKSFNYDLDNNIFIKRLNISDLNTPENNIIIASSIDHILDLINIFVKSNEGVLVHCHMGQQRSAMVIACYLMKHHKYTLEQAVKEIQNKRKFAFFPEATFIDFLRYYEYELK